MQNSPQDFRKKILGRQGEELTVKYLKKHRYKIIAQNYITPFGEADIVALKDGVTCFVEVKTRSSTEYGNPEEAVDAKKQERYKKIARHYCGLMREEVACRFDVAAITDGKLEYYEGAYE